MKKLTIAVVSAKIFITLPLIALLGISTSQAALMLKITDTPMTGAPTVLTATDQVVSGGVNTTPDINAGILGLLGASFSTPNFFLTTSSGSSKPLAPNSNTHGNLFLRELAISSANGGLLTIELSDNDFMLDGLGFNGFLNASIAGRLGTNPLNTVQVDYFYNTSNVNFDTVGATLISSNLFSGGSGFSGNYGRAAVNDVNQPFSITQVIKIHLEPNFQTLSFESDLNVVPEPEMLLVMGLGLAVLVFSVRRGKQRSLFA